MLVVRNNICCISRYGTIYKLVVIRIGFSQVIASFVQPSPDVITFTLS